MKPCTGVLICIKSYLFNSSEETSVNLGVEKSTDVVGTECLNKLSGKSAPSIEKQQNPDRICDGSKKLR